MKTFSITIKTQTMVNWTAIFLIKMVFRRDIVNF